MNKLIFSGILIISLYSCNSYKYGTEGSAERSNLTIDVVNMNIVKAEAKKDEILKLFASRHHVSQIDSNQEVWRSIIMFVEQKAGSTHFFARERASQRSSRLAFDLLITSVDNDVV